MSKTPWANRIVGYGEEAPDQLLASPWNWRIHPHAQELALSGTLHEIGVIQNVVCNRTTGHVVDGHLRIAMAISQGQPTIPVTWVELSESEEKLALLTLDPLSAMAVADKEQLDALLRDVQTGDAAVQAMLAELAKESGLDWGKPEVAEDPGAQMDRAEELRGKWGTERGQIWQVGNHRLMCGDSTRAEDIARLMGGEKAQLTMTSPPYGVGKAYEEKGIASWFETVRPVIKNICTHSRVIVWQLGDLYPTGAQYIEPTLAYSINMFGENGFRVLWMRIWEKQGTNFGIGPYHLVTNKPAQQYEHILATGEDSDAIDITDFEWILAFGSSKYRFVKRLTTVERRIWGYSGVWKINTVPENKNHPAIFPIELPIRCIKMHTGEQAMVLDPFLGSGTTMVAAEQLGRICYGMEISAPYCGVILERMSAMGLQPRLVDDAKSK